MGSHYSFSPCYCQKLYSPKTGSKFTFDQAVSLVGLIGLLAACANVEPKSTVSEAESEPTEEEASLGEQLIEAVHTGDLAEVERLLAEEADANAVEGDD